MTIDYKHLEELTYEPLDNGSGEPTITPEGVNYKVKPHSGEETARLIAFWNGSWYANIVGIRMEKREGMPEPVAVAFNYGPYRANDSVYNKIRQAYHAESKSLEEIAKTGSEDLKKVDV